jgi:hypothetical protein
VLVMGMYEEVRLPRQFRLTWLALVLLLNSEPATFAAAFTFNPASLSPVGHATGINNAGQFAGVCCSSSQNTGFLGSLNGDYTTFTAPGAHYILTYGINNLGQIVGTYSPDDLSPGQGFIRDMDGAFTTFSLPGGSVATGINDSGLVVGFTSSANDWQAFVRQPNGDVSLFTVPGSANTVAYGVNNQGQIVGSYDMYYDQGVGRSKGFIRSADGTFTLFDSPVSQLMIASGINNAGQVVGWLGDYGFLRDVNGEISVYHEPSTQFYGINDNLQIVGAIPTGMVLTTATPEPQYAGLLMLTLGAFFYGARRRRV